MALWLDDEAPPLVFSVPETARLLGISRALAYSLVRKGALPAIQLGRRLVVPRHAVERLLAASDQDPGVTKLA